jgi:O-antigen ligase/polysaccharide polymerase Wzy-like membrane protein
VVGQDHGLVGDDCVRSLLSHEQRHRPVVDSLQAGAEHVIDAAVRAGSYPALRRRLLALAQPSAIGFTAAALTVVLLSAFSGGYYPTAWGWATLACLCVAVGFLLARRQAELTRSDWTLLGTLAAFTLWVGVSALRPGLATLAVPELERTALYLIFLWVALVGCRRASLPPGSIVAGTLTGIVAVCSWGLVMLLFPTGAAPNYFEGRLLYQPIGYANGMGALAAIGAALAIGLSCHARWVQARTIAAGSLVPLFTSLWFSGSRGAVVALAVGLVAMVALDPVRTRLLATMVVALPLPMLAVWVASRSQVGNAHADSGVVGSSGHVVAAVIVLLAICSSAVAYALLHDHRLARIARLAVVLAAVLGIAAFALAATKGSGGALGDRPTYWHAAVADTRAHPLVGSGAGTFQVAWLRYRTTSVSVLNAHNLYLETLAELGPVGLALLVAALLVPLGVAVRSRKRPAAVIGCGAYVVFLAHAVVDWDWQVPAVTVAALLCAVAVMVATRASAAAAVRPRVTAVAVAATLLLIIPVAVEILGNRALDAAQHAASARDWAAAEHHARTAMRWQPWSAEPHYIQGLAQLDEGRAPAARASFTKVTRLNPGDWRAWFELGNVSGPKTRARALERINALNPVVVRKGIG